MTDYDITGCKDCGADCRGARCTDCEIEHRHSQLDTRDPAPYDCPECGRSTSGRGVTCYRCRGD